MACLKIVKKTVRQRHRGQGGLAAWGMACVVVWVRICCDQKILMIRIWALILSEGYAMGDFDVGVMGGCW